MITHDGAIKISRCFDALHGDTLEAYIRDISSDESQFNIREVEMEMKLQVIMLILGWMSMIIHLQGTLRMIRWTMMSRY